MCEYRMLRILLVPILAILLMGLFPACNDTLRSGDLVFVCADTSGMDAAISASTADKLATDYSHVGIIEATCDSGAFVIDASPKYGVSRHSLRFFMAQNEICHFYRVKGYHQGNEWVENAKRFIGAPYDLYFLPDNGRFYCSEFVADVCVNKDGTPVFTAQPMNFRASDGTIPDYWVQLFDSLGVEVPQGIPGTNPNDIAKSGKLQRLDLKR